VVLSTQRSSKLPKDSLEKCKQNSQFTTQVEMNCRSLFVRTFPIVGKAWEVFPSFSYPCVRVSRQLFSGFGLATMAAANTKELETKVRDRLVQLYKQTPCMPIMVRIAWHDAGTYDVNTNTGGVNGSVRFDVEQKHKANAGLKVALDLLAPIKKVRTSSLEKAGNGLML